MKKILFSFIILVCQVAAVFAHQLEDAVYTQQVQQQCAILVGDIGIGISKISRLPDGNRLTELKIIKTNSGASESQVVGEINLVEYPVPQVYQTYFMLDLLHVYDGHQGQGIGPKTLNWIKGLATTLSQVSSFYQTIGLLSQDIDYFHDGRHVELPKVPRRVDFYMKSGFQLHSETIELIKFLDIGHMVRQISAKRLADYMGYYVFKGKSKVELNRIAINIFPQLREKYKDPMDFDFLLGCVRFNGNESMYHILNRAYYREGITDAQQKLHPKFSYLLSWTAEQEPDQRGLSLENAGFMPTQYLASTEFGKDDYLLADQLAFNRVIAELSQKLEPSRAVSASKRGRPTGSKNKKRARPTNDDEELGKTPLKILCTEELKERQMSIMDSALVLPVGSSPHKDLDSDPGQ